MTKDEKTKLVNQIMIILDSLSEDYLIHSPPLIKKSDNIERGWGGNGKRKTTINFVFQTEKPTRKEIESRVKGYVDLMSGERL
jgi:hypothetical protein